MEVDLGSILNKLHIRWPVVALSILLQIPAWFISIYLFHKGLFNSENYYVIIAFCFCFSIAWYLAILFLALLLMIVMGMVRMFIIENEKEEDVNQYQLTVNIALVASQVVLYVIIFFTYSSSRQFDDFIENIFNVTFPLLIFLGLLLFRKLYIDNRKLHKVEKKK